MYYNGISKTHWQERLRAELGDERFKEYMLIQALLPPPEELHVPASVRIALERQEAICGRDDEARGSGDPAPKAIKEKAMPPAPKPAMLGNMVLAPHLQISPKVIAVDPPPKKASAATPLAAPKAPVETLPKVPVSPLTPPEAPVEAPPKAPVETPSKAAVETPPKASVETPTPAKATVETPAPVESRAAPSAEPSSSRRSRKRHRRASSSTSERTVSSHTARRTLSSHMVTKKSLL